MVKTNGVETQVTRETLESPMKKRKLVNENENGNGASKNGNGQIHQDENSICVNDVKEKRENLIPHRKFEQFKTWKSVNKHMFVYAFPSFELSKSTVLRRFEKFEECVLYAKTNKFHCLIVEDPREMTQPKTLTSNFRKATQIHYPHSPLFIRYGKGCYLYDEHDKPYLDLMNNVAHGEWKLSVRVCRKRVPSKDSVGHSHPRVTKAAHEQISLLNTNSRFLHHKIIELAEKLTKTFPKKLNKCFFVNSGTEANDLAMRLARTYTKHKDVVVLDDAYHGHSVAVVDISPYKFKYLKHVGQQDYIHVIPRPDSYRGIHRGDNDDPKIGEAYANEAIKIMNEAVSKGREIGMFIAESMMSCGGQIIFPPGFLKKVYEHVHSLGGICVADEVQVGFGRIGNKGFWGFELQDVVPDIVTVGKPFGNGHPVSCVITTEEIAGAFADTKVAYFNTFGGNPVSMAIGLAVMEVIEIEGLQENAEKVGKFILDELIKQKEIHDTIGDIRGVGLFVGIEIVKDRNTREPGTEIAKTLANGLRENGVLISRDGPDNNVLKIKPPMVISTDDVKLFIEKFHQVLTDIEKSL